jgi:hypothetical protein
MQPRVITVISLALLSAACASPNPQSANRYNTGPTPSGYIYASSEQACADYGFVSGSATFERCVSRERAARSAGRMTQTYEQSRLTIDAQNACASYGLDVGSSRFDRCVGREVDARSYRADAPVTTPMYRTNEYGYRIDSEGYRVDADGYRIDAEGRRMARQASYVPQPQPYYAPQPQAYVESRPTGQPVTRDEFGFRYDAYGNRVDARGNVVSPQTR